MPQAESEAVQRHYTRGDLGEAILAGVAAAGISPDALTPDNLAPVDQFHTLGGPATLDLLGLAELRSEMRVLDLSEEFCRVGEMLTARTGLSDRVTFLQPADDLRRLLRAAGFCEVAWRDVTAPAKEGVARQMANAAPGTATLGLHLLFGPRFAEIGANHTRNLQEDRIAIIQAVLERP